MHIGKVCTAWVRQVAGFSYGHSHSINTSQQVMHHFLMHVHSAGPLAAAAASMHTADHSLRQDAPFAPLFITAHVLLHQHQHLHLYQRLQAYGGECGQ